MQWEKVSAGHYVAETTINGTTARLVAMKRSDSDLWRYYATLEVADSNAWTLRQAKENAEKRLQAAAWVLAAEPN